VKIINSKKYFSSKDPKWSGSDSYPVITSDYGTTKKVKVQPTVL
jgi:hypothetical protein